jgi:hypothetical protein
MFTSCLCCNHKALVDESGVIRLRWGHTIDRNMVAVHGTLCIVPPCNSNLPYEDSLWWYHPARQAHIQPHWESPTMTSLAPLFVWYTYISHHVTCYLHEMHVINACCESDVYFWPLCFISKSTASCWEISFWSISVQYSLYFIWTWNQNYFFFNNGSMYKRYMENTHYLKSTVCI